jgi:hypothetical protein
MKWKKIWPLALLPAAFAVGCKPDQIGFLNENMRYNVSELQVTQGTSISTPAIISNGSSTPMTVELIEVRNKETGAIASEMLVPAEYSVFLQTVGAEVMTLEQLASKLNTKTSAPIDVNEIGGKVTFSPSTENVAPGLYTIDLKVTNIAGTKTIKEALDFRVLPMKADSVFAYSATSTPANSETNSTTIREFDVTVEHIPNGPNKIIYVWEDKNGNKYNPKAGEVIRRSALPSFADWSPFYPEELTDTAIVYEYPYHKGLVYPLKSTVTINGSNVTGQASNYRLISEVSDIRRNINTSATVRFYKSGTHIVRHRLREVVRTGVPTTVVKTVSKSVNLQKDLGYSAVVLKVEEDIVNNLGITYEQFKTLFGSKITYALVEPNGTLNPNSTAAAPGHWINAQGGAINWGDGAVLFSELKTTPGEFHFGQFPGRTAAGQTYKVKQALIYDPGTSEKIQLVFDFTLNIVN